MCQAGSCLLLNTYYRQSEGIERASPHPIAGKQAFHIMMLRGNMLTARRALFALLALLPHLSISAPVNCANCVRGYEHSPCFCFSMIAKRLRCLLNSG
jgi:hypothetical protein